MSISPSLGHFTPVSDEGRRMNKMWCLAFHKIRSNLPYVQNAGQTWNGPSFLGKWFVRWAVNEDLLNSRTVHGLCRRSKGFQRCTNLWFLCVPSFAFGCRGQTKSCRPSSPPGCFRLRTPTVEKKQLSYSTTRHHPCTCRRPDTKRKEKSRGDGD